jgi:hypothetical protein
MKKIYFLIALIANSFGAFPNSLTEKHELSSWFTLLLFGLLFIGYFTYLFIKAQSERVERQKMEKADEQNSSVYNESIAEKKLLDLTDGLIKLFNLRKKGFISEQEYNRLKEKLYQNG